MYLAVHHCINLHKHQVVRDILDKRMILKSISLNLSWVSQKRSGVSLKLISNDILPHPIE